MNLSFRNMHDVYRLCTIHVFPPDEQISENFHLHPEMLNVFVMNPLKQDVGPQKI